MHNPNGGSSRARIFAALTLLWLTGIALRLTILAVPPIIPRIHHDLNLDATQIGILTGLPSMLFAFAAVPGSLLIARLGVRTAMIVGLALTALGGALRGSFSNVLWLYAMTIGTGAGVAIMQVTMPPAVRAWTPHRIGFATAVYTNGLIAGEILPVALTLPLVLPLVGGSWQWGLVIWSAPVAIIAILVGTLAPPAPTNASMPSVPAVPRRWWPDWHSALIWRLGLVLGTVNAIYFATNAFLPDYLHRTGQSHWISAALSGINLGQIPASMLLLPLASRLVLKVWPYTAVGVLSLIAITGIVFTSGPWIVAAATLLGFGASTILILVLALPPLLSAPDDVHRVTAAMFTVSYSCAVVIPIISGFMWDISGVARFAFIPIAICAVALIALAPSVAHVRPNGS